MKNKILAFITGIALINLLIAGAANAQQDMAISIIGELALITPDTLTLPTTFIDKIANKTIYQPFQPNTTNNQIKAIDTRNDGGFTLTLQVTNFTTTTNTIPYTNVGLVTLANAPGPVTVDTSTANSPPIDDSGTVSAPLDCDWDEITNFGTFCEGTTTGFKQITGTGNTSDAITIIDGKNPTAGGRSGQYWLSLGMKMLIPPSTAAGEYKSTFTFTINATT